jgi:hypothetical protein
MQSSFGKVAIIAFLVCPVLVSQVLAQPRSIRHAERGGPLTCTGGPTSGAITGGSVVGGVAGVLGPKQGPRLQNYAVREGRSSYRVSETVRRGMILPQDKIALYRVPAKLDVSPRFRYAIVNGHLVLVHPRTRQVVEVTD